MNTPAQTAPFAPDSGGVTNRLRRIEAWMDARGRKAWIAAMVAGFVFFWPVGLALVAYITVTNRWSRPMSHSRSCMSRSNHSWSMPGTRPSGNTAFDTYKADTLKRLEDEQDAFEAFLQRLRDAKDKSEFDTFMDDRAKGNRSASDDTTRGDY